MSALLLTALLSITALVVVVSLIDSFVRGRHVMIALKRERALAIAGFVPQADACDVRLRRPAVLSASAVRPFARRTPRSMCPQPTASAA